MPIEQPLLQEGIRLREAGDLVRSHAVLTQLVNQLIEREGRESPDCLVALSQLGRTLRAMNSLDEAAGLHWEVLAVRTQLFGRRDSRTQNSSGILCDTLRMMSQEETALQVQQWASAPDDTVAYAVAPQVMIELYTAVNAVNTAPVHDMSDLIAEYLRLPVEKRLRATALRS